MSKYSGIALKSKFGIYEKPEDRGDSSSIYLLKSLKGLNKKERIYALGYNISSISAVTGFDFGLLAGAPYMIGETLNNIRAFRGVGQGDFSKLRGRTGFLGSANLMNKYASKAFNAVTSPTGVGAVDRYVNIYVGQERAKFLQYVGSKSRGEQMKVFVETLGRVFDNEVKKQVAGGSNKGNVFAKWRNMTYYNAVKNAPNPWKENPYVQARKTGSRRLKKSNMRYNTSAQAAMASYSGDLDSDNFLRDMMAQSDEMLEDVVMNQSLMKAASLDSELRKAGVAQPNVANVSNLGEINKLFKEEESRLMRRMLNRRDNIAYKTHDIGLSPIYGPDTLKLSGPRGLDSDDLERYFGLKVAENGQFTTNKSRKLQQKKLTEMNSNAARDIGAEIPKGHGKAAALAKIADTIPMNAATVRAFEVFATELGVQFPMKTKGATRGSFSSAVLSVLYSGNTETQLPFMDLSITLGAVGRLAAALDANGMGNYAKEIVKLVDPKMKAINTKNKSKTLGYNPTFNPGAYNVAKGTHFMDVREEVYQINEKYNAYTAHRKHVTGAQRAINKVNASRRNIRDRTSEVILGFDSQSDMADSLDTYYENLRLQKDQLRKTPITSKSKYVDSKLGTRKDRANLIVNYIADSQSVDEYIPVDFSKHSITSKHFQIRKDTRNHLKHIFGVDQADDIADAIFGNIEETLGGPKKRPKGQIKYDPKLKKYVTGDAGAIQLEQYKLSKKLGKKRAENYKKLIKFIQGGAAPQQILNYLEHQYDGIFGEVQKGLNKAGTAVKAKAVADAASYSDIYVPDKIQDRKGNLRDVRKGQSTMYHNHNNYVPTRSHIIDAIHMHPVEFSGKDETDGSEYLFQFQVSFGGRSSKSKTADRIRDAAQIEFGGQATDKFGGTRRRGDRMIYLPSFFLGTAATMAAASLGIFDRGVAFSAATPKGTPGMTGSANFKMSDDAVGPFNNLRRKFNQDKKEIYEGHTRVKKVFKDMKSTINNPRRQLKNFDHVATRMAAYRAMSLFKKGGGFGEVRMGDITKRLTETEAKLFGIDTGSKYDLGVYSKPDVSSIGFRIPQATKLDFYEAEPTFRQTFHDNQANYKRQSRNFRVDVEYNTLSGMNEIGYAPILPAGFGNFKPKSRFQKGKEIESQIKARSKYDGVASFRGQKQYQSEAVFVNAALNGFHTGSKAFSQEKLIELYEAPYDTLEEWFQLGKPAEGARTVWGMDNVLNNPHHPDNPAVRFMELIGTNRNFEAEMIRQMMQGAEEAFAPILAPLMTKKGGADNIMNSLRFEAAKVAYQTRRALNSALMHGAGSDYFTDEMFFRTLTFQLAELVEASKVHFQTNIKERLSRAMGESRLTPTVKENLLKKLDKGEIQGVQGGAFSSGSFSAQADVLASGGLVAYADDGSPFVLDLAGGTMKESVTEYLSKTVGYTDNEIFAFGDSVSPNYTGMNRKTQSRIYLTEGRRAALLQHMGVDDFEEIQWNRSKRFGMQDVNPGTKQLYGDNWALARQLENATGGEIKASEMLSNPEQLIAAAAKVDKQLYDEVMAKYDKGASEKITQAIKEMNFLDAYRDKVGLKSKYNISKKDVQFGKIVAETTYKPHVPRDTTFDNVTVKEAINDRVSKEITSELRLFGNSLGASGHKAGNYIANKVYYPLLSGNMDTKSVGAILRYAVDTAPSNESAADFIQAFIHNVARKGTSKQSLGFAQDQQHLIAALSFMATPELTMVRMPSGNPSDFSMYHILKMVTELRSEKFQRFTNINQIEKILGTGAAGFVQSNKRYRKKRGSKAILAIQDPGSEFIEFRYYSERSKKFLTLKFNQKKYTTYIENLNKKKRGRKK
jgi:hypothetical protein